MRKMIDIYNRYKANHRFARNLPLIGYLILCIALIVAFGLLRHNRSVAKEEIERSIIINCQRINELSDKEAQDLYDSFNDLPRATRIIGIPLTEELEDEQRQIINKKLLRLHHVDCQVLPPHPALIHNYPPIVEGKPTPTVPEFPKQSR